MRPALVGGHSGAFVIAGVVMIAGLANAAVTTFEVVWPWMMAGGVAIAAGLFRLASRLQGRAARVGRTGRVLACIAGAGALVYVAVTVSFLTAGVAGVQLPAPLEGLFGIGGLGFLTGVILASVLLGSAALRHGTGSHAAGLLLLLNGLLFLSPFPVLLGLDIPEAMPFISVALLAIVQLLIGYTLRPTATGPSTAQSEAPQL